MGPYRPSRVIKVFLAVIVVDLIVIGGIALPVVPVSSSEVMFVLRDHPLENGTYVYRWFDLEEGDNIRVDFTSQREVNAYIFTKHQFTNYSNVEEGPSLDSSMMVEAGKLETKAKSSGTYFFVVHNPSDQSTELIHSEGTGITVDRVTLAQVIKGYLPTSEETGVFPYYRSVRDNPGIGSNS